MQTTAEIDIAYTIRQVREMFGEKDNEYDSYNDKISSEFKDESIKARKVIGEYLKEEEKIIWAGGRSGNKEILKKHVRKSRLIIAVGIILTSTIILTAFSIFFVISTCAGIMLLLFNTLFEASVSCQNDEFMAVTDRRVLVLINEYFRQFELTNIKSTECRETSPGIGRITLHLFEYPFSDPNYIHTESIYNGEDYDRIEPPLFYSLILVKDPKVAKEAIDAAVMRVQRK